jgi:2-dehydro-3-deoxyphosphogluconate aldolase/(4S)-4-hydroxy-2-oxoglutarate aldolase
MTRTPLHDEITSGRIIAIARKIPTERLASVAEAMQRGGLSVLEITLDAEDALASIGALSKGPLLVGAGTVMDVESASDALEAGATFLVSPHTDPDIVSFARSRRVPIMTGALTPTEIAHAWDLGVSAVKVFPASLGGPSYLRAIRGPLSDVALVPTGGVDAGNAREFLRAGAVAVGVGGWLTDPPDAADVAIRVEALVEISRSS